MSRVRLVLLKSILGRVKELSATTIVVESERGGTHSVVIGEETIFTHSGLKSPYIRPKVGDRVLVDLYEDGGRLVAVEIHFGTFKVP